MAPSRKWTEDQLVEACASSRTVREVLIRLRLAPAGGNYWVILKRIRESNINIDHFTRSRPRRSPLLKPTRRPLSAALVPGSNAGSYKLKKRLFAAGLKDPRCELCGWAERSSDGRLPLELHHVNGIRNDNRLENLQILCPNCHSLQPTHRGRNIGRNATGEDVPGAGLEPARAFAQDFLRVLCLPFHHPGSNDHET